MIVEVKGLTKRYGAIKAVDDVSFEMHEGEILGLLGPNGAGKTTLIECIEGLKRPDAGTVKVLGMDPVLHRRALYQQIGVQLQEASYPDTIKVDEICRLFSSFYEKPVPYKELLQKFGMVDKKHAYVSKLSGGQKQRLSIILALIPNPRIVFLDELTTGLDPQARYAIWELIQNLRQQGVSVFMTTHYMEEAEYLCDRVAIMERGKIVAFDTVSNLIAAHDTQQIIEFSTVAALDVQMLHKAQGIQDVWVKGDKVTIVGTGNDLLSNVLSFLQGQGTAYRNLKTKNTNLEDVFLKLTGHTIAD